MGDFEVTLRCLWVSFKKKKKKNSQVTLPWELPGCLCVFVVFIVSKDTQSNLSFFEGKLVFPDVHDGTLLGARGNGFVMFWDWESGKIVR